MTLFLALRVIYGVCLIATVVVGLRLGARSERAGALIMLAGSAATVVIEQPGLFDWSSNRTGLIVVDLLVLAVFLHLALTSRRFWPLWATAFHLIAVCSHLVAFISPDRVLQIYALLQGFWAYPILTLIVMGSLTRDPGRARVPLSG